MPAIDDWTMPKPPDLYAVLRECGGYGQISVQQWALFDKQTEITKAWLRARHKQVKAGKDASQ